ncbi:NosD domain-containing protein [Chachezhania antarctica]|uniref:NosD domain-containing protein n=1 Tax=Chachezhania antarctica TaxID=2340860 RepID=UPI000EB01426|nr:NosD domain-containing protein [Chachezhania antarctica]
MREDLLVTDAADRGPGTLRAAIVAMNKAPDTPYRILFHLPDGQHGIRLKKSLPDIAGRGLIDAPVGEDGAPLITVHGADSQKDCVLRVEASAPCEIRNLILTGAMVGLVLKGAGGHAVCNCILTRNTIGLLVKSDDCRADGVIATRNRAQGISVLEVDRFTLTDSRVGCDRSGTEAEPNRSGLVLSNAQDCRVGPGNVISGNRVYGLSIVGGRSRGNHVFGNFIGCDATGAQPVPNTRSGILVFHASDNVIGGARPEQRNVISGNLRNGVNIDSSAMRPLSAMSEEDIGVGPRSPSRRNRVIGNHIGVDASGTAALPNGLSGVLLFMSQDNQIGGAAPGEGNVLSGNARFGINVTGPNPDRPNWRLFALDRKANEVIQTVPDDEATPLTDEPGNRILGNIIGADATGQRAIPNGNSGIGVFYMPNTVIGDEEPGSGNTISGNTQHGVTLSGDLVRRTQFSHNRIGTAATTDDEIRNEGIGILFRNTGEALDLGTLRDFGNFIPQNRRSVVIRNEPAQSDATAGEAEA